MTRCDFCGQRKGKRSCPALGAICSECCGQHRRREIDCPEDCQYLRPGFTSGGRGAPRLTDKLLKFVLNADDFWARRALDSWFGGAARELASWEMGSCLGYVCHGYVDERGEGAIDRLLRRGSDLSPAEREILRRMRESAWVSLFEIVEVRRDVGLDLLDVLTGERTFVREKLGTHSANEGDHLLGWVFELDGWYELTGGVCVVPDVHVNVVADAMVAAAGGGLEARAAPRQASLWAALPSIHATLREAVLNWMPKLVHPDGEEVVFCRAVYEARDAEAIRAKLSGCPELSPAAKGRFSFRDHAGGLPDEIELRTVRLSLFTTSRSRLERCKRFVDGLLGGLVRHRVDRFEHLSGGGSLQENEEPRPAHPVEPVRAVLDPRGRDHRLPPMAHEIMKGLVPGLSALARDLVATQRRRPGWESRILLPPDLMQIDAVDAFLHAYALMAYREQRSKEVAASDTNMLGNHLFYTLNFELHGRKTFWVDESLAWMLSQTELDIVGRCLRLPFPACAFVFTDRSTLELGESLLSLEQDCSIRDQPLRIITAYVTRCEHAGEDEPQVVNVSLLFDAGQSRVCADKWPYLVSRDLFIRPDDHLEGILDSRLPGLSPDERDPIFLAPELKKLVHVVINAILYATSAHLDPVVLHPSRRSEPPAGRKGRKWRRLENRAVESHKAYSDEDVFHLPGHIDISHVRQYGELMKTEPGRALMKRFMVRGHWRRANPGWTDQRLRWIEPYWKGPDLAMVIERDYRLRS